MSIVGTPDYDALDAALQRGVRVSTVTLGSPDLREYKRAVILHAVQGTHRAYVPTITAIARHGIGHFSVKPELQHLVYTALAETLLQLLALTPVLERPLLHRDGERSLAAEQRLLGVLSDMYATAADRLISRHILRAPLDEEFTQRRQALDDRFVAAHGAHKKFLRTLSDDLVALSQEHIVAQAKAREVGESRTEPFREIAQEPQAHVRSLQVAMSYFTGRPVRDYHFH